ncbi:MAG: helix-turn-helix transcriptional regulator [Clostridia bacterium]|nr:helix-turn-helix transcriptional regulator [Clostridia bacterium]
MSLSADLLRGYTDTIILRRLEGKESYGYQINKEVTELSHNAFELKEATLYTAFRRLETSGCIVSRWGDEATGARRRYYSLTETGKEKLARDTEAWVETRSLINLLLEGKDNE